MQHRAQLRVCHELIYSQVVDKDGVLPEPKGAQYCSLHDVWWCYECGYYVCEIHAVSRHSLHDVRPD